MKMKTLRSESKEKYSTKKDRETVCKAMSIIGKIGGQVTSEAKKNAAKKNGMKGGRPPNKWYATDVDVSNRRVRGV